MYLCCCRLLELAGVKREDAPLKVTLCREVKAVFNEVDESEITDECGRGSIEPSVSESIVDALKHNPYVDSGVPSFETSLMQHAQSWDAVEDVAVTRDNERFGKSQLDVGLLKPINVKTHGRRASDSSVTYACDRKIAEYRPTLSSVYSVKLEPLSLSKTNKKKRGKGKKVRSIGESSGDSPTADGMSELSSFSNSLKQNAAAQLTDRIQVAKCLASSACADGNVHNRVERIKVSGPYLST